MPNELTVFAPIRPGQEEMLRNVLRTIGDDIRGQDVRAAQPHIDFSRTRTHFARFVVLPHPDLGPERFRLLFAAVYDGELQDYLAELSAATNNVEAIWGACEGYSNAETFRSFIDSQSYISNAFYKAFRDQTLADVRNGAQKPAESLPGRIPAAAVDAMDVIWNNGLFNSIGAALEIGASLNRIRLIRLVNWVTQNRMARLTTNYSEVSLDGCAECTPKSELDEVVNPGEQRRMQKNREDRVAQNQLTLITVTDPARVKRLTAVMALIGLYSRRFSKPGSLAGISTIHFVRWLIIDNGKRLIMISDYDGSWEAYIEEFAEMILSGLDAIWRGSIGFPSNGARDVEAFKRFLRCRQYQADLFYSGYPDSTVFNILQNRDRPGGTKANGR